jgi:hypothetical protein
MIAFFREENMQTVAHHGGSDDTALGRANPDERMNLRRRFIQIAQPVDERPIFFRAAPFADDDPENGIVARGDQLLSRGAGLCGGDERP